MGSLHSLQNHAVNLINNKFVNPSTHIKLAFAYQKLPMSLTFAECSWPRHIYLYIYISDKFTVSQLTKVKWLQECRIWNINSGAPWTSLFGHWFSFHRCRCYYGLGKILANYKWNINSFCKICKQYFSTNNG